MLQVKKSWTWPTIICCKALTERSICKLQQTQENKQRLQGNWHEIWTTNKGRKETSTKSNWNEMGTRRWWSRVPSSGLTLTSLLSFCTPPCTTVVYLNPGTFGSGLIARKPWAKQDWVQQSYAKAGNFQVPRPVSRTNFSVTTQFHCCETSFTNS
jgi:hypothetical protein